MLERTFSFGSGPFGATTDTGQYLAVDERATVVEGTLAATLYDRDDNELADVSLLVTVTPSGTTPE